MTKSMFGTIKEYMHECMKDSAHDSEHVYRVLYMALHIAGRTKASIDDDVLIAASLLHDIGRNEQFADPKVCHARAGGTKAKAFLLANNWSEARAEHVKRCISTHRFRGDNIPESMEAKILFDADKLDVAGGLGIVRTLMYKGQMGEPLYSTGADGICDGKKPDDPESFYKEYHFKLKNLYSKFYTSEARRIAKKRKKTAERFFHGLSSEVGGIYRDKHLIDGFLEE